MGKLKRGTHAALFMILGAIVLMALVLPSKSDDEVPYYEKGKPWLHPMLTAKMDIPIEPLDTDVKRIKDSIENNSLKYFNINSQQTQNQLATLSKALEARHDIKPMVRQRIVAAVSQAYEKGIVDDVTYAAIHSGQLSQMLILDGKVANQRSTDEMRSAREAYIGIYNSLTDADYREAMARVSINNYLTPNVTYDATMTKKKYDEALAAATVAQGEVQKGESIIYPGNIVDARKDAILKSYSALLEKTKETDSKFNYSLAGNVALVASMMLVFYFFMLLIRTRTFVDTRRMLFLTSLITVFVMLSFLVARLRPTYMFMMPFALVPIVATTFTDNRIGFFVHLITVILCSIAIPDRQAEFIIMQFIAGGIAIASMQGLLRRSQLVECAFYIFVAYSASYCALCMSHDNNVAGINDWHIFLYFAISCVVLSFAYTVIFLEEKLFKFTSSLTLVELSDSNSPLLRELSKKCPGTFQHSLQVANLATEVAHRVGANIQVVRASAMYHDIGKIANPQFFTENQTTTNPHNGLNPDTSASIVISHVTEGLKLAKAHNLPQVLRDAISQHHGRGKARYFYITACKAHPGEEIDPEPYTYPGPNPQTKETAIIMMCDACEAAAKSLADPNYDNIKALVDRVIDGQVADGLLSEAPISFSSIDIAKKSLTDQLCTLYHPRISYPDDVRPYTTAPATASKG